MKTSLIRGVLLGVMGLLIVSCSKTDRKSIRVDGSSTVFPVTEAVSEEFQQEKKNLFVSVGVSGTGGGFKKFVRGETAINDASRTISKEEKKIAEENGIEYMEVPIAYDGISVVVHPENDWCDQLTVEELRKIWKPDSKVDNWNDIRDSFPDRPLKLYGPGTASGTFDYFTETLVGESGSSRSDFTSSEDDNVLVRGIAGDENSLGYFGYAYYRENKDKMKLLAVDNGDGAVKPSVKTIESGKYRPLSRPLFFYVRKEAAQRKEVQEFVSFYLDHARELVPQTGYVPMSEEKYEATKQEFYEWVKEGGT